MAIKKAKKPKYSKGKYPTMTGNPPLGYLNSWYCPVCGKHLFSYYDGDMKRPSFSFKISDEWNYCSKCGTLLDLDEWKDKGEQSVSEEELVLED